MSDKSKEISYYAFETRINQNVLNLLKPIDEQKIKDQEQFREIRAHDIKIDQQVDILNKTVFENGKGVQIFELIKSQLNDINLARADLEKKIDSRFDDMEFKIADIKEYSRTTKIQLDEFQVQQLKV